MAGISAVELVRGQQLANELAHKKNLRTHCNDNMALPGTKPEHKRPHICARFGTTLTNQTSALVAAISSGAFGALTNGQHAKEAFPNDADDGRELTYRYRNMTHIRARGVLISTANSGGTLVKGQEADLKELVDMQIELEVQPSGSDKDPALASFPLSSIMVPFETPDDDGWTDLGAPIPWAKKSARVVFKSPTLEGSGATGYVEFAAVTAVNVTYIVMLEAKFDGKSSIDD